MNRVTTSRLLNGIGRDDPYEVLQQIPGPESLRGFTDAAGRLRVAPDLVERAVEQVDAFSEIIRSQFGTRDALNAAISSSSEAVQKKFHEASRYDVYKGMRQLLGVDAETWLTSMFFMPNPEDEEAVSVTTIHGTLAMRRLRPDVNVYFTFGAPYHAPGQEPDPSGSRIALDEFYENDPAPLITENTEGQIVHRLAHGEIGKQSVVDMLAVSYAARGSRRNAQPGKPRRGVAIFPDVPVRQLFCDALVHRDLFKGDVPELLVYNPGVRGPANPNDPTRDVDRVEVPEQIKVVPAGPDQFDVPDVPNYAGMIHRTMQTLSVTPDDFRVYRLRMNYPVHGFQFVMAFRSERTDQ